MEETEAEMDKILQGIDGAVSGIVNKVKRAYNASEISAKNMEDPNLLKRVASLSLTKLYNERSAIRDILEGKVHKVFDVDSIIGISRNGHTIFAENGNKRMLEDISRAEGMAQRRYAFEGINFMYRTQTGAISDLFNNSSLDCCAFHPDGRSKHWAALYTIDPNTALIHLVRMEKGYEAEAIGVAICFFAGWGGRHYLVVDSVEGKKLTKRRKHDFQKAITIFAQQNGCEGILYNTKVNNTAPKGFNIFLSRVHGVRQMERAIAKKGGDEYIGRYGIAASLFFECFPGVEVPDLIPKVYKRQMHGLVEGLYQPVNYRARAR